MQYTMVRADVTSCNQYRSVFSNGLSSWGEMRVELRDGHVVRIGWSQSDNRNTGELHTELKWLYQPRGKGRSLLRHGDDTELLLSCTGGVMNAKLRLRDALRVGTLAVVGTDD